MAQQQRSSSRGKRSEKDTRNNRYSQYQTNDQWIQFRDPDNLYNPSNKTYMDPKWMIDLDPRPPPDFFRRRKFLRSTNNPNAA
ncbi:MAG: hypothetical protein EZS28_044779 [Streblomastix strix]|uniref:Uncharacterized protein n=1 Tax=Streblomastix strix TaxID=222440 RepID=A0A5J4TMR7_9EUKA|nr:MAG: hypothetical protein EZS28_044779 [Streblomastix strix]